MVTRTLIIQPAQTVSIFELFCLFEVCNVCVCVLMHSSIYLQEEFAFLMIKANEILYFSSLFW
jgi:hypothetical protein